MRSPTIFVAVLASLGSVAFLDGQDRSTALPARTVSLRNDGIGLAEALAAVRAQTGTEVVDRRTVKEKTRMRLDLEKATFWQGIDSIARQADARISLYQDDGRIALISGPYRALPTSLHGIFRTTVRRLGVVSNLETGNHLCTIELQTAWEPWFRPFLMEVGPTTARYAGPVNRPVTANVPGRGRAPITGRAALTELPFPAPPRTVQSIDALAGSFKLIGPTKILTFRFDDLKAKSEKPVVARQEGVKVELARVIQEPDRWSFDMVVENPPGGPTYESHEEGLWLNGTSISLQRGNGQAAIVWKHSGEDLVDNRPSAAARAAIRYHFELRDRSAPARVGKLSDWSLVYTTPGPIIETKVDFSFADLRLP